MITSRKELTFTGKMIARSFDVLSLFVRPVRNVTIWSYGSSLSSASLLVDAALMNCSLCNLGSSDRPNGNCT